MDYPVPVAFLQQAHAQGIKIALGSASKNAPMILDKMGLTPLFDAIIDGNNVINGKPHPEVFLKGAAALGSTQRNASFSKIQSLAFRRPRQEE
jgi:beta-phosphoglucomutase